MKNPTSAIKPPHYGIVFVNCDNSKGVVMSTKTKECFRAQINPAQMSITQLGAAIELADAVKMFSSAMSSPDAAVSWGSGFKPFFSQVANLLKVG
jgi:ribosomal protein L24E